MDIADFLLKTFRNYYLILIIFNIMCKNNNSPCFRYETLFKKIVRNKDYNLTLFHN